MSTPVTKRACDQCHGQKLRCSGADPCTRCSRQSRECTYLKPKMPKGRTPRTRFSRDASDEALGRRRRKTSEGIPSLWDSTSQAGPSTSKSGGSQMMNDLSLIPWDRMDGFEPGAASWTETSFMDILTPAASALPWVDQQITTNTRLTATPQTPSNPTLPSLDEYMNSALLEFPDVSNLGVANPFTAHQSNIDASTPTWLESVISPIHQTPNLRLDLDLTDQQFTLLILTETLFRPQMTVYFERINPMMPVLERSDMFAKLDNTEWMSTRENLALVLVITGLALVHSFSTEEKAYRMDREKQALMLLDQACHLVAAWDYGCVGTIEKTLTSFLMFGILHEVGQVWGARMRLRDAVTMGEAMGLNRQDCYVGLDRWEVRRRSRMFYILALTERAYALQRSSGGGNLVFGGRISTTAQKLLTAHDASESDPVTLSLQHLAELFSYIDKDLISCWIQSCGPSTCTAITWETALDILVRLKGTEDEVFASQGGLGVLTEAQRADCLITWQWIKSRIWLLASLHGLTSESGPAELSSRYVVDIALMTVEICNVLSFSAMECHGTGFVEKLYEIAQLTAMTMTTLSSQPPTGFDIAHSSLGSCALGLEAAQNLQFFVSRHHRGTKTLGPKLQEAIVEARMAHHMATITSQP